MLRTATHQGERLAVPMRECSICHECKPLHEFGYREGTEDNLAKECRACHRLSSRRSSIKTALRHYEEKYQSMLTQESHPGYVYRCCDSDRNGQHCNAVLFTRYNKVVVEFDDGHRIATSQVHLRRAKEN